MMVKRRKRRSWSDDEKREICQQTAAPGVTVAQVARRYALNANMIHTWLKDPRFAPPPVVAPDDMVGDAPFIEVAVSSGLPATHDVSGRHSPQVLSAQRVDITLSDGRRILIEGPTALSAVLGLVQGLSA